MNPTGKFLSRWLIYPATGFLLLAASACNFGPSPKQAEQKAASNAGNATDPGIDLNCIMDRIQNPPEAFHYSYKHDGSNSVDEEADITPQTIDGTFKNNDVSRSFHGDRSDQPSWQGAGMSLMGISGMSSTMALVRNSSATVREGAEKVNGYDAIRYSVDTARASGGESSLYSNTLGPGGFEKGGIWVTSQGCPVRISIDSEMHLKDGSVHKDHYEEAMVKK
ncbi:MAG: hypothetical protein LAN71_01100 [Acidobacteriia bacterium]|nr:hypothetical protein [Terriglobia bacterium]